MGHNPCVRRQRVRTAAGLWDLLAFPMGHTCLGFSCMWEHVSPAALLWYRDESLLRLRWQTLQAAPSSPLEWSHRNSKDACVWSCMATEPTAVAGIRCLLLAVWVGR